jgi:hypothetical protein
MRSVGSGGLPDALGHLGRNADGETLDGHNIDIKVHLRGPEEGAGEPANHRATGSLMCWPGTSNALAGTMFSSVIVEEGS